MLWVPHHDGPFFSPMPASSSRAAPTEDNKLVFSGFFSCGDFSPWWALLLRVTVWQAEKSEVKICRSCKNHPKLSLYSLPCPPSPFTSSRSSRVFFLLQPYKCARFLSCNPINAHLTWTVFEELIYLVLMFYVKNVKVPKNQPKEKLGPAIEIWHLSLSSSCVRARKLSWRVPQGRNLSGQGIHSP